MATIKETLETVEQNIKDGKKALSYALQNVGITNVVPNDTSPNDYETFQSYADKISGPEPKAYEAIDLGLPSGTLWANKNVGALNEKDYGLYFQWADVAGYQKELVGVDKQFVNDFSDYKWYYNGNLTKYTGSDGNDVILLQDDAATAFMRSDWFYNKADHSKYIFLPAGGHALSGSATRIEKGGYYWTSSLFSTSPRSSRYLIFYSSGGYGYVNNQYRYYGCNIRACYRKNHNIVYNKVDLGLPSGLLWANKNIGATTEEDSGLYFQWGDIQGYAADQVGVDKQFTWDDYKWSSSGNFTKYTSSDGLTTLESSDDAATQIMGSDWRMPTQADFQELVSNTDIYFISTDGSEVQTTYMGGTYNEFTFPSAETMKGMKFYNKTDHSKYIFVPASGVAGDGSVQTAGVYGYLWSSSLGASFVRFAWGLYFGAPDGYGDVNGYSRYVGFGVRGVAGGLQ